MDPQLQTLTLQLADVAARNTASAIVDHVQLVMTRKRGQEAAAELQEIVNQLVNDKLELVRIAQAYEQELVAQQISQDDVRYITDSIIPVLTKLMESGAEKNGEHAQVQQFMDVLEPILSVETLTVLQLLGFNFRKAIGEPLTDLVGRLISARIQAEPTLTLELQRLALERDVAFFEVAKDPEAHARLRQMNGQQ